MKIYMIGVNNVEDPYRVKLIRDVLKESKSDKLVLEMCDSWFSEYEKIFKMPAYQYKMENT